MADSNILGLFASPEQYQMAQQMAAQQRAMEFAGLNPSQQAQYGAFLGGSQLGTGIARGLGGQDRQLALISQRQALSQELDPSNPESFLKVAQKAIQSPIPDQEFATTLAEYARKAQSEIALTHQRMQERKNARAKEIQIAETLAANKYKPGTQEYNDEVAAQLKLQLSQSGDGSTDMKNAAALASVKFDPNTPEWKAEYEKQLNRLTTKPEKDLTFGAERESKSFEMYDKPFRELTQAEKAVVNKRIEDEGRTKAREGAAKLIMPGDKKLEDIPQYRRNVQMTIEPQSKAVNAADQALSALDESMKSGNFASWRAAQTQFARAISGTGDLSQKELKAAGADPSLIGGSADYLSTLFTSTPTLETQRSVQKTLQAIKTVAAKKARDEIERQRRLGERAGYKPDDISAALDFPEFAAPAATVGGKKTKSWNELK